MADRPNILIIHADQHRWDCLGAYGNADVRTPNIDALANEGVRYGNHFCTFPICTPSRYSMLTGLHVRQHGCWGNVSTLPQGIPALPRLLRDSGYLTAAVGKMHFTPTYLDVGFDRMLLAEQCGEGRYDDDYHRWLMAEGLVDKLDMMDQVFKIRDDAPQDYFDCMGAAESDLDEQHHSTTWIGDRAFDDLAGWSADAVNFLMVGFIKPHHPFDPPAPWSTAYDPQTLELLPGWTESVPERDADFSGGYFDYANMTEQRLRTIMAMYYGAISQIDHHVGRMIQVLQDRGLYENTLIVYTSDHGDYMGFHHLGLKGNLPYDPLARIPLIIKWPGSAHAGECGDALSSNIDIMPTLLAAAGIDTPERCSGVDLGGPGAGHEQIVLEANRGDCLMIRTESRKLILRQAEGKTHLFDLERDPLEMEDLADRPEYQADASDLRSRLSAWALSEALPPNHRDRGAPLTPGDNVIGPGDPLAKRVRSYYMEHAANPEWPPGNAV